MFDLGWLEGHDQRGRVFVVIIISIIIFVEFVPHDSYVAFSSFKGWRHGLLHDDELGAVLVLGGRIFGRGNGRAGGRHVHLSEKMAILFEVLNHSQVTAIIPEEGQDLWCGSVDGGVCLAPNGLIAFFEFLELLDAQLAVTHTSPPHSRTKTSVKLRN